MQSLTVTYSVMLLNFKLKVDNARSGCSYTDLGGSKVS